MRILTVGPLWRGSNAGGMFRALSRGGCLIEVVDEFYHISLRGTSKKAKIAERLMRPMQETDFNNVIRKRIDTFQPAILFVYKGAFVRPDTIQYAKQKGCKAVMFYPDVSMTFHGTNIPRSIPLYDLIFTTKTFGIKDMQDKFGVKNAVFMPHGYDPEIHRPLTIGPGEQKIFGCDASFIGTWSPKKEQWLTHLREQLPAIDLKVWGDQWHKASSPALKGSIMGKSILGDLYALAIQASKINLAILSEQVSGSSSGDLITSRTFHIPGAQGFMLHERNEESVLYFREDEEAGFFDGPQELADKVRHYLANDSDRTRIRLAGYKRACRDHSLDARAAQVLHHMQQLF